MRSWIHGVGNRERYRVRCMAVLLIRVAGVLMALAAIGIAAVPLLVLVDLLAGGTGYGLCAGGIEGCHRPYSAGPELALMMASALFALVLGFRVLMKLARRLEDDSRTTLSEQG